MPLYMLGQLKPFSIEQRRDMSLRFNIIQAAVGTVPLDSRSHRLRMGILAEISSRDEDVLGREHLRMSLVIYLG